MQEWSNKMGHRGRKAWCLVIVGDAVSVFDGKSSPAVAVLGTSYCQNGKWSATTYRLETAAGVRLVTGHDGWETGTFAEGLASSQHVTSPIDRWVDLANALGVSVSEAQRFLKTWRPEAASRFDAAEAALEAVDAAAPNEGASQVAVSFGSPTNKISAAGFWSWPVVIRNTSGTEVGRISPTGQYNDWGSPDVVGPVAVLASERAAGYHGGTVSLRLAVPEGCTACHEMPRQPEPPVVEEPAVTAPVAAPAPVSTSVGAGAFAAAFARRR